jgi:hypothetical protein
MQNQFLHCQVNKHIDTMNTINLFNKEIEIDKEYSVAVCVYETNGSNLVDFTDVDITLGQKVYNVKILATGSIIFTLSPESDTNIVTMFPQMFGFPSDAQIDQIKKLEDIINESQRHINEIYDNIERAGFTDIS